MTETLGDYLARHGRRFGLLVVDAGGRLAGPALRLGTPSYDAPAVRLVVGKEHRLWWQ